MPGRAAPRKAEPMIQSPPDDRPASPRVGITAVGASLPERILETAELQDRVARDSGLHLPPGMFARSTGIERRRMAGDGEYASTLAVRGRPTALAAPG